VWGSTQGADLVQDELTQLLGIPKENIVVNVTFVGGGFGRRLFSDYASEAAYLSKQTGTPVKVIWTREDDTSQGPFRPGTYSSLKGALDRNGKLIALHHKVVAPSIDYMLWSDVDPQKVNHGALEGISECAYEIPNYKTGTVFADVNIPLGWWRAVYSSTTAFPHESFIDELAHKAKKDPLEFRLEMISGNSQFKKVLLELKDKSAWTKQLPKGWGRGIAVWEFFAGLCGQVVEVSKDKEGKIKIERVVAVIDCGIVVNPDNVKAQIEGGIIMGLTAALKDEITIESGRVKQSNFHNYRLLRMNEVPLIEVHIIADGVKPRGVGEPGVPPLAPALANAIFNATGKRIRKLPFKLDAV